jgi:hypothetical protein
VSENRVLREIFGPERGEVTGEWRKLYGEDLQVIVLLTRCYLGDKIKEDGMGGACSTYGGEEKCTQSFDG